MKKLISAALALAMGLSLAACGQSSASSAVSAAASSENTAASGESISFQAESEAAAFPVTVTDQAGRTITINEEPHKIASGSHISSSALIALGVQNRMAGIEAKADERALYSLSAPELIELPDVGSAKAFNVEACSEVEPDLVILPVKLQTAAELLVEEGIQVLYIDPESENGLASMITLLGQATGTGERAEQLLTFLQKTEADLTALLAETSDAPSVYFAGSGDVLSAAGSEMYPSALVELAGGKNAAAELNGSSWSDISYEQLLSWNPDWIVLASDAAYTAEDVLNDENLAGCTAVQKGQVVQMPGSAEAWESPVPGSILGSVWLASQLHPEAVSADYAAETIQSFYNTFYGFDYAAASAENI